MSSTYSKLMLFGEMHNSLSWWEHYKNSIHAPVIYIISTGGRHQFKGGYQFVNNSFLSPINCCHKDLFLFEFV